jgi:hypothetical protein
MVNPVRPPVPKAIRDPAALPWHEVKKVDHYWLSVDAAGRALRVREGAQE